MLSSENSSMTLPVWLYIILWFLFLYLFVSILSFQVDQPNNILVAGMYFIEFGIHEASHLVVFFLPAIIVAGAGSAGEILFTILLFVAALKSRAYFAGVFAGLWIMLAMNSVGRYMADARSQLIPLVGPGETIKHDWNYIFGQLGWLDADIFIGTMVRVMGYFIGVVALGFGLWLIIKKLATD